MTALEKSWNKETYAYFMEMGTGKTKVLIDNMSMLYDKGKVDGALIVAPKGKTNEDTSSATPSFSSHLSMVIGKVAPLELVENAKSCAGEIPCKNVCIGILV